MDCYQTDQTGVQIPEMDSISHFVQMASRNKTNTTFMEIYVVGKMHIKTFFLNCAATSATQT